MKLTLNNKYILTANGLSARRQAKSCRSVQVVHEDSELRRQQSRKFIREEYMIRDWREEDAPSLAKYANNKEIWQNLRDAFPHPYYIEDAERFIAMTLQQKPTTIFAIASATEEAIGGIGLTIGTDVHRYTAELGYWLAETFWGKGIMSEAINKFTDYAFKNFKLHRIYAEMYAANLASVRVLEKAGYKFEGKLRAGAFKDGVILDQFLYAKVNQL